MNETLFVRPVFSAACKMKASLRGTGNAELWHFATKTWLVVDLTTGFPL